MSQHQAEAAVVEVANIIFGRAWKFHGESEIVDLDTLPASSTVCFTGKAIEAQALVATVEEIINSEKHSYNNMDDCLKKQGADSFSVQGVMVNGIYRALTTLSLTSESRKNLFRSEASYF